MVSGQHRQPNGSSSLEEEALSLHFIPHSQFHFTSFSKFLVAVLSHFCLCIWCSLDPYYKPISSFCISELQQSNFQTNFCSLQWSKSAWEKLWQGMWMSSGQSKESKRGGEEPVAAVSHQMAPHCFVSFIIRPGIIFRKLFLKLFRRFRHQWLLYPKQLKNSSDLQKAAHFSFPVILFTRNPAPQFSLQEAPEVEMCWKLLISEFRNV